MSMIGINSAIRSAIRRITSLFLFSNRVQERSPSRLAPPLLWILVCCTAVTANSQAIWTGGGGNSNWTTSGNWSTGMPPNSSQSVTINAGAVIVLDTTPTILILTVTGGSIDFKGNTIQVSNLVSVTGGSFTSSAATRGGIVVGTSGTPAAFDSNINGGASITYGVDLTATLSTTNKFSFNGVSTGSRLQFTGTTNVASGRLYVQYSNFNPVVGASTTLTKTGGTDDLMPAGNIFSRTTTLALSGSARLLFAAGATTNSDTFNGNLILQNTASTPQANYVTGTNVLTIGESEATTVNGNVDFITTQEFSTISLGDVWAGNSTGVVSMATGSTLTASNASHGAVSLSGLVQLSPDPLTLTLGNSSATSNTTKLIIGKHSQFFGNINFSSPIVMLNGGSFNGNATLTMYAGNPRGMEGTGMVTFNGVTAINLTAGSGSNVYINLGGGSTYNGSTTITNSSIGTIYTHRSFNTGLSDNYSDNVTFQNSSSGNIVISTEGSGQSTFTGTTKTVAVTNTGAGVVEITRSSTSIFNGLVNATNSSTGYILVGSGANSLVYFSKDCNILNNSTGTLSIADNIGSVVRFGYQTDNTTSSSGGTIKFRNNGSSINYTISDMGRVYFSNTALADIANTGAGTITVAGTGTSQVTFDGATSSGITGTVINNNSTGIIDIGTASGAVTYFFRDADIINNSTGTVNISNAPGSTTRFGYQTDNVTTSTGGTIRLRNIGGGSNYRIGNVGAVFFSSVTNTTISNENSGAIAIALNYSSSGTCTVNFDGTTTIANTATSSGFIYVSLTTGTSTASTSVIFNNAVSFQNDGFGAIMIAYKVSNSAGASNVICNAPASFTRTNGAIYASYGEPTATNASIIFNGDAIFNSNWSQGIRVAEQPSSASATFRADVTLTSSYNPGGSGHSGIEFGMGNGSITIDGNGSQTISHSSLSDYPSYVGSLLVNKSAGVLTVSSVNPVQPVLEVESKFTLTSGIVKTNRATNYASINLGAGVITPPGSSIAYFDGPISKTFNNVIDFDFHVGNGSIYRRLSVHSVNASAAAVTTFVVEYKKENWTVTQPTWGGSSTWPTSYVAISGCEYWWLDRTIGTASANSVTLTWKSDDCPATYIGSTSNLSELKVTKWNGTNWIDLGGTSYTGDYNAGSVTSLISPITTFSPFTIASTLSISPLPITLSVFNAKVVDKNVEISWSTATEINNDYFEIERSDNGLDFVKIGEVDGNGTTAGPHSYSWLDQKPLRDLSYYRLRQVDFDEQSTYSNVISISNFNSDQNRISFFPNPASDKLFATSKVDVKIVDVLGNVVLTGHDVDEISLDGVNSGVYCVMTSSGVVYRFVKN